jgi:hypothetical protein
MEKILSPGTSSILISWDDPRLTDLISMMFFPWNSETGSIQYYVQISAKSGGYLIQTPLENTLCPDENDLLSHLEFNITTLSQKILIEYLQIHAACCDFQEKGVLIIGDHGSGKSTLALSSLSYGMKVLTDDVCIIDPLTGQVTAFPRPIKASDNTLNIVSPAILGNCPVRQVFNDTSFIFHYVPYISSNSYYQNTSRPEYIFFLKRTEQKTNITRLTETESMNRLLRQGFNFIDKKNSFVHDLLRLIRSTERYELYYENNWKALDTIIATIQITI